MKTLSELIDAMKLTMDQKIVSWILIIIIIIGIIWLWRMPSK